MNTCNTCRHWFADSKIGALDETRLCVWLTGLKGERVGPLQAPHAICIRTLPTFGCACHEKKSE